MRWDYFRPKVKRVYIIALRSSMNIKAINQVMRVWYSCCKILLVLCINGKHTHIVYNSVQQPLSLNSKVIQKPATELLVCSVE